MLRLDTDKLYYLPAIGDKPPVTFTLGQIVGMMEQAMGWHDDGPRALTTCDVQKGYGKCATNESKHTEDETVRDLPALPPLDVKEDDVFYSRELCCKLTYAQMVDGMDPEVLPKDKDDLELLLWAYDAEAVVKA